MHIHLKDLLNDKIICSSLLAKIKFKFPSFHCRKSPLFHLDTVKYRLVSAYVCEFLAVEGVVEVFT